MSTKTNIVTLTHKRAAKGEELRAYEPNSFLDIVDVNENVLGCGDGEGRCERTGEFSLLHERERIH